MKKLLAVCACTVLSLSLSGCSLGTVLEQITSTGDVSVEEPSSPESAATEPKSRVYMDEISGTLQDFSGSQLILNKGEASYVFNLSGATLECKDGMITGDEISVIYEGQLSGTDTSTVQTLKVVDEFHRKSKLKKRTAHGQVLSLTANTITLKSKKGKLLPIRSPAQNNIIRTESKRGTGYICILKESSPIPPRILPLLSMPAT